MARPRIFVSSTYYDLKYIRASLELFIESLGFESVLSEKGDIAYTSDRPLDESCYREVENADVFVLIVGGRYGSEASTGSRRSKDFFERYESITKKEYGRAVDKDIPVYVLIERAVHAEFQTFIRNKSLTNVQYAHVDSVNVFLFIEEILAKPSNNPVQMFDKFEDIQSWLREQWAGLFRELLRRQAQQLQLAGLSEQVDQLKETNETLKTYLEAVMRGVNKREKSKLIEREEKRLSEAQRLSAFRRNPWVDYVLRHGEQLAPRDVIRCMRASAGFEDFCDRIDRESPASDLERVLLRVLKGHEDARRDFNRARQILDLPPFKTPAAWIDGDPLADIRPGSRALRRKIIKAKPTTSEKATDPTRRSGEVKRLPAEIAT